MKSSTLQKIQSEKLIHVSAGGHFVPKVKVIGQRSRSFFSKKISTQFCSVCKIMHTVQFSRQSMHFPRREDKMYFKMSSSYRRQFCPKLELWDALTRYPAIRFQPNSAQIKVHRSSSNLRSYCKAPGQCVLVRGETSAKSRQLSQFCFSPIWVPPWFFRFPALTFLICNETCAKQTKITYNAC